MGSEFVVALDRQRAKRYFLLLTGCSLAGAWVIWFVMGFMGSNASPDGITLQDLVRTTAYSLPIGLLLSAIFPLMVRAEKGKKWVVNDHTIQVFYRGELQVSLTWDQLDDVIFREYSVAICPKGEPSNEHTIFLPSETMCNDLSMAYNRSKGRDCAMDKPMPPR